MILEHGFFVEAVTQTVRMPAMTEVAARALPLVECVRFESMLTHNSANRIVATIIQPCPRLGGGMTGGRDKGGGLPGWFGE